VEGQTELCCRDCNCRASVRGELPSEYAACFSEVVRRDGWVVAPGAKVEMLCGECLARYEMPGGESRDDSLPVSS
jgi:hypothetical protein